MPSRDVVRSSPNMAVDADSGFSQALAMVKPIATILATSLLASLPAHAEDAHALLRKYKCNSCHAEDETRTGPAFVDIATRYRGDSRATATLAAAIKDGARGAGPWHMPPHPEVSAADARALARYILALKK